MQAIVDMSAILSQRPEIDLLTMCGSRYNTFVPGIERRDEPNSFFRHAAWRLPTKRPTMDDETDRWDGLE